MSPGKLHELGNEKLDKIASLSSSLVDLKLRQEKLLQEKDKLMKEKSLKIKASRIAEFNQKTTEMDEKERDLCRKTNQLVDDFVQNCDDSPFQKALINILNNLKGIFFSTYCVPTVDSKILRIVVFCQFWPYCTIWGHNYAVWHYLSTSRTANYIFKI